MPPQSLRCVCPVSVARVVAAPSASDHRCATLQELEGRGASVAHGVDATQLDATHLTWATGTSCVGTADVVVFNYPCVGHHSLLEVSARVGFFAGRDTPRCCPHLEISHRAFPSHRQYTHRCQWAHRTVTLATTTVATTRCSRTSSTPRARCSARRRTARSATSRCAPTCRRGACSDAKAANRDVRGWHGATEKGP
jgi:hypothetical protein